MSAAANAHDTIEPRSHTVISCPPRDGQYSPRKVAEGLPGLSQVEEADPPCYFGAFSFGYQYTT
jgi:hypothetical protein